MTVMTLNVLIVCQSSERPVQYNQWNNNKSASTFDIFRYIIWLLHFSKISLIFIEPVTYKCTIINLCKTWFLTIWNVATRCFINWWLNGFWVRRKQLSCCFQVIDVAFDWWMRWLWTIWVVLSDSYGKITSFSICEIFSIGYTTIYKKHNTNSTNLTLNSSWIK